MFRNKSDTTGPLDAADVTSQLYRILTRANNIASTTELDDLLSQMLDLIILICGADAGTLYLLDKETNELVFRVVKGDEKSQKLVGTRIQSDVGIVGAAIQQQELLVIEDLAEDTRWFRPLGNQSNLHNAISMPLLLRGEAIGAVQVFNFTHKPLQLAQFLGNRMASEIEKAVLLQASERSRERLEALVSIIRQISSTLDQELILTMIIQNARELLNAEASSLFLVDNKTGDLILHIAQDVHKTNLPPIRMPAGSGIIGYVVQTGEAVRVNNAAQDERHFRHVDDISGIKTQSLLAVPLISPTVDLGQERGMTKPQIIGGLEAINKLDGVFTAEDEQLLIALAHQAATVLHIAHLYADANELFLDTIKALAAAVDAKDPYTEGHSQRVSEFSLAIGRELGLHREVLHQLRIGSLFHDLGKIGVPDDILGKPDPLTPEEYREMKKHPAIGANILGQVRMLQNVIPAIEQHHERMDASGYPRGLRGEELSLFGRIVSVADAFDAITSDRPYRKGVSAQKAIEMLYTECPDRLDKRCVDALAHAYQKGLIQTQKERNPES